MKKLILNRVEVIDHTKSVDDRGGRAYVYWEKENKEVEFSIQDKGKTLKIFIQERNK
jgi:predicted transcriptional regulator